MADKSLRIILGPVVLLVVLQVFMMGTSSASVFYVATTGNDSNPGNQSAPFKTLKKGVSVLRLGDTLYVRGGIYAESLINNIPSGS